ncbi:MAG TPA: argininosuccinate lyase [Deltaproteobacteria bacterium]|nr:argininosuccinate lyase [Deltaproteobacteria bacterium]
MTTKKKPWDGRFKESTDRLVEEFTASIHYDRRLYRHDIEGSIAHCKMLAKQKIISAADEKTIVQGLTDVLADIEEGTFDFSIEDEDIHMAVERSLISRVGDVGGKLHAGRSRNDQVCLDIRLYLRNEVKTIIELLRRLKSSFLAMAKAEIGVIMPGYTHMQKAQPVLLSHYLLAYWEMFNRDEARFEECYKRINIMPLGSAALAGTGIPLDRAYVAELLQFPDITKNSMDAVADRDFIAEFIFAASLLMMHMSRFCEEMVIWSTEEVGFVEISDSYTTGSSIMPQKKNPDVAELIRGKTGRIYGNLVSILTILKALPMTYNRDLQEDKEPLFDTVDTLAGCLSVLSGMTEKITFKREKMLNEAKRGFSTATDIAEYLVMNGVPFRDAHEIVGRLVSYCIENAKTLESLTIEEFKRFYDGFADDVFERVDVERSVNARNIPGGTSQEMVMRRIKEIG